jgi:hypothetical protein
MLLENSMEMGEEIDENNKRQEEKGGPRFIGQHRIRLHVRISTFEFFLFCVCLAKTNLLIFRVFFFGFIFSSFCICLLCFFLQGSSGVIAPTVIIAKATTWPVFQSLIVRASIEPFDPSAAVASIVLYS